MRNIIKKNKVKSRKEWGNFSVYDSSFDGIIPIFPNLYSKLGEKEYSIFELNFCKNLRSLYIELNLKDNLTRKTIVNSLYHSLANKYSNSYSLLQVSSDGEIICIDDKKLYKRINYLSMVLF